MSFLARLTRAESPDLALDLGTTNTLVHVRGRGIVLCEPSLVAVDSRTREVLAVGTEARQALERAVRSTSAVRPLRNGAITDLGLTAEMLKQFIQRAGRCRRATPRMVVAVTSGATSVQKKALELACLSAGARQVFMLEKPIAAAIGAGLPVGELDGSLLVDIGGGTTEIAAMSLARIVVSQVIEVGGDELNRAIVRHVRRDHRLLIGRRIAEQVKLSVGSAFPLSDEVEAEVRGRDVGSGLAKTVVLSSEEMRGALEKPLVRIVEAIKKTLARTPPDLGCEIVDRGMMLAGGGSLLRGLRERLREETKMPAQLAEYPLTCVAAGSGIWLHELAMGDDWKADPRDGIGSETRG
jgi:rod shape-determining protein MreB